jgi:hypothetical protein
MANLNSDLESNPETYILTNSTNCQCPGCNQQASLWKFTRRIEPTIMYFVHCSNSNCQHEKTLQSNRPEVSN